MTVTTPQGFRASGVAAGLKSTGDKDVALIVSDGPLHVGVGVFTTNRVVAAPVVWSRQVLHDGRVDAVVLNSGGANACTGPDGFEDTHTTAEKTAESLYNAGADVSATDVAVCSTGLIGVRLAMDKLIPGVDAAVGALDSNGGMDAARAIMTTDTVAKTVAVDGDGDGWSIGGIAKGAGMFAPALATMLVVLTTDAVLTAVQAKAYLAEATRLTFDRADSDGCISTNDTVLLLASGASGVTPEGAAFESAMTDACSQLTRALIADCEGASHDVEVTVINATTEDAALAVAREIARSNLLKAAIFGNDPNWGRVIAAAGAVSADVAPFDANLLDVTMNGIQVCRASGVGEARELVDLTGREVSIVLDLHAGEQQATIWTNDLTHDYVHENSAYSS